MSKRKTNEEFIFEMRSINPNIKILERYINAHTKVKCECLIDGYVWSATPNNLLAHKGCPVCGNKRISDNNYKTHQQFLVEMSNINSNIVILGKYLSDKDKIECQCAKCKYIWSATPSNLLQGSGCPVCAGNIKKSHQQFKKELLNINPNIKILSEYNGVNSRVKCKCLVDGYEWDSIVTNLLKGHGCPRCAEKQRAKTKRKTHKEFVRIYAILIQI